MLDWARCSKLGGARDTWGQVRRLGNGETFRCTKIRHHQAAYLYSAELRGFSELGCSPWPSVCLVRKSAESFGRVIWVDSRSSRNRRSGRTGIISRPSPCAYSGIRPRPLDVGNLNRGLCALWVWRIGYERCVAERMYVRKCVRMHKCPHVSTDM